MLLEEFDNWRKQKESNQTVVDLPRFTNGVDWRDDFSLFMRLRYCDVVTPELVCDLAWQIYMLQACVEGIVEDICDVQEEILKHEENLDDINEELWDEC